MSTHNCICTHRKRSAAAYITMSFLLITAPVAFAQTTATWTGAAGTTAYNTPGNWDIGVVPITH